jgi:hypothetical protein
MQRAFELGIDAPKTLHGWADFFPRYTTLPWLNGKRHRDVQVMRDYLRIAFNRIPIGRQRKHPVNRWVHEAISAPARWRLDHDCYALPFELKLKDAVNRWFPPLKAKVDAHQLSAEAVTC